MHPLKADATDPGIKKASGNFIKAKVEAVSRDLVREPQSTPAIEHIPQVQRLAGSRHATLKATSAPPMPTGRLHSLTKTHIRGETLRIAT